MKRRRGFRWTLPISAVMLCFSLLLLTRGVTNEAGLAADSNRDYERGQRMFGRNLALNINEPWVARNNRGVELYQQRQYDGAIADFSEALRGAPKDRLCFVSLNLTWSWEAKGDVLLRDGKHAEAAAAFTSGAEVLKASGCADPTKKSSPSASPSDTSSSSSSSTSSSGSPSSGKSGSSSTSGSPSPSERSDEQKAEETQKRLEEKSKDAKNPSASTSTGSPTGSSTTSDGKSQDPAGKSAQLEGKRMSAEAERQSHGQYGKRTSAPNGKPW